MNTRTIAIIGGGPAGATAAEKLAQGWRLRSGGGSRENRVLVFEEKIGWEKPCGGGLSHKALRHYPLLAQATGGGNLLRDAEFLAPTGAAMRFHLREPLAVYSRATLNQLLLQRAEDAGAEIVADRILGLRQRGLTWEITGRQETYRADFVVLAAGARTRLRQALTEDFLARDFMLTFGYYLPVACEVLRVQFYENFEGYAWAFPRVNHVSVGICGKAGEETMAGLRERLAAFMQEFGYAPDPQRRFSHLLPSLSVETWGNLRLTGQGWGLVGDAAGLVDPVTGEGIYYAMRSGDLLAEALLEGLPEVYPERVRNEFGRSLAMGARLARMFYRGEFLGGGVTTRMIEFGTYSRRFLEVIQDLVEGSQSYLGLIARLHWGLAHTLLEAGVGRLREVFELPQVTKSLGVNNPAPAPSCAFKNPPAEPGTQPMPTKSQVLFAKARRLMPGGVNSPVRAFRAVGGDPIFIASGKGARMTNVEGKSYIDYVLSWGPLILGHAHPEVVEALARAAETGTSFGACTPREVELAERIVEAYPSIERVRLVNSGTEATLSALRVARAATGRDKILKFEGCYHGHGDSLLVKAGSGVATLGLPDSPGVPRALAELTVTVPFNDVAAIEEAFRVHRHSLAAAIVEPVVGNMGCVPPQKGFLEKLRALTHEQGTVLIFDEVMTGFRVAYGGAQHLYKIDPDMTTLGKIIGGGLPVGAYGGKAQLMDLVAPAGPVYQAGTLSGNPLAVAAGLKTLEILRRPGLYERLDSLTDKLTQGLIAEAARLGVVLTVNRIGSMFTPFFTPTPVSDYASAKKADTTAYGFFFRSLLDSGVYFPPSQFEAAFVSTSHSEGEVTATLQAASSAFSGLRP